MSGTASMTKEAKTRDPGARVTEGEPSLRYLIAFSIGPAAGDAHTHRQRGRPMSRGVRLAHDGARRVPEAAVRVQL